MTKGYAYLYGEIVECEFEPITDAESIQIFGEDILDRVRFKTLDDNFTTYIEHKDLVRTDRSELEYVLNSAGIDFE